MSCPVPRPIHLMAKFVSWNNHLLSAINHKLRKATSGCSHFIWMLTPFSNLQGVAGAWRLREPHSSQPFSPAYSTPHRCPKHSYTPFTFFYLPLLLPPPWMVPHDPFWNSKSIRAPWITQRYGESSMAMVSLPWFWEKALVKCPTNSIWKDFFRVKFLEREIQWLPSWNTSDDWYNFST